MKRQIHIPFHPRLKTDGTSILFARELEQISLENFNPQYAELKAMKFVPMDTNIDRLAERWTYRSFDALGEAALIKDYSKKGFPRVGEKGAEESVPLRDYGDSFGYSLDELARSKQLGRGLDRERARIARDVVNQKLEKVICTGDSAAGLKGFFNLTGCNSHTVVAGASTSKLIENKTADEQLTDLEGMLNKAAEETRDIESSKRLLLYPKAMRSIMNKPRSSTDSTTVYKFFKENHPEVELFSWERLADAGTGGAPLCIAYDPNPIKLRCLLPIAFEQMDPELDGMEYSILCRARTGGVINPFPKSVTYADFA